MHAFPSVSPPSVRTASKPLSQLKDSQLSRVAQTLREDFHDDDETRRQAAITSAFALSGEALRRTLGIELYNTQLLGASALIGGHIAEMETGEGKTFAAAPAAIVGALQGKQVHIATPNTYLAQRDFELLNPALSLLGIKAALLPELDADPTSKVAAYHHEVIYGTGYEFGFDYLRGALAARQAQTPRLGQRLLERLHGGTPGTSPNTPARYDVAIVDEADNVLIDEACSPLILSGRSEGPPADAPAYRLACSTARALVAETDYLVNSKASVQLTRVGLEKVHATTIPIPVDQLRRSWAEYIEQAVRAHVLFHRDADYVIADDTIRIVDASTGRIFGDRTWNGGLHQAIEAKEGVPITNEQHALAQITRQRFYRLYETLAGMTGTAAGCERELSSVYSTRVFRIPRRNKCLREDWSCQLFATKEEKLAAIVHEVRQLHTDARPVLIGTKTIAESERVAALLEQEQLPHQLLNGRQDAEEAEVVAMAGQSSQITIATNLAGRGTDIPLSEASRDRGGLHVIVVEPHDLYRVDRQLIGRCARAGDPGSARTFLSAEDSLVVRHAPWLRRSILHCAKNGHAAPAELRDQIRAVQHQAEQQQATRRMELLKRDVQRDEMLTGEL